MTKTYLPSSARLRRDAGELARAFYSLLPSGWSGPLLWIVYAVEAFLICLNVYSCIVYTRAYWPYMLRAIRS